MNWSEPEVVQAGVQVAGGTQMTQTVEVADGIAPPYRAAGQHAGSGSHRHVIFPGVLDTLRSLLSMVVLALFILTFIVQPFRIPSESMERTLMVGDFLMVNKATYGPPGHWGWLLPYQQVKRQAIVVFHFPLDPADHVVKRIVGLPGDHVRLQNGSAFVNGERQQEPYAIFEGSYPDSFRDQFPSTLYTDAGVDTHWWMEMRHEVKNGELVVPPDSYFVLGDNRNNSRDSRYWGLVPRADIVGRPFLIYFSLREGADTEDTTLPDDRLGHENNALNAVMDFARWGRTLRVVQ